MSTLNLKNLRNLPVVGGLFGNSEADDALKAAFGEVPGQLDAIGAQSDARRKAALKANLSMFDPVDSLISRMYGPGAVSAPIDVDALFGTMPQQKPGYYQDGNAPLNDPNAVQGGFDAPGSGTFKASPGGGAGAGILSLFNGRQPHPYTVPPAPAHQGYNGPQMQPPPMPGASPPPLRSRK